MHLARLARLQLDPADIDQYRADLATVLGYFDQLQQVDVEGIEPLAHPADVTNPLAADQVGDVLPVETIIEQAPRVQGSFIAVPKVIQTEGGGGG